MAEANKNSAPAKTSTTAVKKTDEKLGFFKRVGKWFREFRSEVKKVVWPTLKQVVTNTGVALGMMAVSAVALWLFDTLASLGVQTLIELV